MKLNEHLSILTPKILLVPYTEHHVPVYHEWMQDEELQQATASEPLTLPEEYAMQKSWRNDADKLTFIISIPPSSLTHATEIEKLRLGSLEKPSLRIGPGLQNGKDVMVGDVNLFLYPDEDDGEDGDGWEKWDRKSKTNGEVVKEEVQSVVGEIEIMVASKTNQGKGIGKAALLTFMWYIASSLDEIMKEYHASHGGGKSGSCLSYLRVKINEGNAGSIRLFESAGFEKVDEMPNYFGELELRVLTGRVEEFEAGLGTKPLVLMFPG